jgi:hypothetical protein
MQNPIVEKFGQAILYCLILCGAFAKQSMGQDSTPLNLIVVTQEPAAGSETFTTTPLIQITFEDPESKLQKETMIIEVDRSDVTSLAQFANATLLYQPPVPLEPGTHDVRISGTLKDGAAFQEVNWNFKIGKPESGQAWAAGLIPSITYEYALRREQNGSDQDTVVANVGFNFNRPGTYQTFLNSTFQGQDEPMPDRNQFDLASFQAGLNVHATSLLVGDVVMNQDQLSISNLARRGIWIQQGLPFYNSTADFFSVRSETIFGFRNGLGISDSSQRIDGGSFFFSPTQNEKLGVRLYYLTG